LKRAVIEKGYAVASLGAWHTQDIKAWKDVNPKELDIKIITYDDLIKNYSEEALVSK